MIDNINSWRTSYLDSTEGSYTHVEEDTIQHGHRDELQVTGRTETHVILAINCNCNAVNNS